MIFFDLADEAFRERVSSKILLGHTHLQALRTDSITDTGRLSQFEDLLMLRWT